MTDTKTKQVALYARVSTKDKGQDVENQLAQLGSGIAVEQKISLRMKKVLK